MTGVFEILFLLRKVERFVGFVGKKKRDFLKLLASLKPKASLPFRQGSFRNFETKKHGAFWENHY